METYADKLRDMVQSGELTVIDSFKGDFVWLSNFYYYEGETGVTTVEHIFQAAKPHRSAVRTTGEGDEAVTVNWQELIRQAETPGKAKRLGNKAPLRKDWDDVKGMVMYNALHDKFLVRHLAEYLLATGDIPLIEGNTWHDNYWGDCRCGREECSPLGHNHLGILLMRVRDELRAHRNTTTLEIANE